MVMTPSLPTFCIAWAMSLPMVSSPLALMVPTWAMSPCPLVGLDMFLSDSTIFATAPSRRTGSPWLPWSCSLLLEDAEDLFLAQDDVLDAVEPDLVAAVLAEQDPVALLDVERAELAVVVELAGADGDHLALSRLL